MKLIKELENTANIQADLKKSDATDAGNGDAADSTDLEFKTLRSNISKPDEITGAAVKDYLEKAAEINDEVDTIVFGLEDDDGSIVKVYVAADQADNFEAKMAELLGLEDDLEAAINKAAEQFDIVDVVWPESEDVGDHGLSDESDEEDYDIDSIEDIESENEEQTLPIKESNNMDLDIEEGWYVYNQKDVPIAGPIKDENKAKKKADDLGGEKLGFSVGYTSDFDSRKRKAKLNEADDMDGVRDGMNIPMDSQYSLLAMRLKRPIEKKIVAFFSMTGIPGRYVINVDGVDDAIRSSADMLRKNMSVRRAFDEFYMLLAQAKGYSPISKVEESEVSSKRGTYLQKKFETILIALGMPEQLVVSTGPAVTSPMLFRVAKLIDTNQGLESALNKLALRLGLHSNDIDMPMAESKIMEEVDVGNDEFLQKVIQLVTALGVPEDNLNYRKSVMVRSMREKKLSLRSRGMIEQRMDILLSMINANTQKREQ